jgi:hypothetical protein
MPTLLCPKQVDACGFEVLHPDCLKETIDSGLGPGKRWLIQTQWITNPDTSRPLPEVWIFVDGYHPRKLDDFSDGSTYSLNWDFRRTIQNGRVRLGFFFPPTADEVNQGLQGRWIFSNDPSAEITYVEDRIFIQFNFGSGTQSQNPFDEQVESQDPNDPCLGLIRSFGVCIYDCCPGDCTKPYDNNVFCLETHVETDFAIRAMSDPGLAKQVFLAQETGAQPLRSIALTRSGDAYDQDLKLLYGSQQWVMVWDLELNRLMDVFPREWLRYGAGFYFQNQTLRKDIKSGVSSRKPYYVEIVDLGLTNGAQGVFDMDLDSDGQRSTNWDVPSRLISLRREGQQFPVGGFGVPRPPSSQQLYADQNHLSVDAYLQASRDAVPALRERFFHDRNLFLDHTTRQRFHDQVMFMAKEAIEHIKRLLNDMVETGKNLVDTFNPEAQNSFGYFVVILMNAISKKIMRTRNDISNPILGDFKLEADEETSGDWLRYIYGEIRRLVEIEKIDKKDYQTTLLEALEAVDPANPTTLLAEIQKRLDPSLLKQEYDLAANGRVPAGNGLVDPDTKNENTIRGIPTT